MGRVIPGAALRKCSTTHACRCVGQHLGTPFDGLTCARSISSHGMARTVVKHACNSPKHVDRVEDDLDELQAAYVVAHTPADGTPPPFGKQLHETVALLSLCHAKDIVRMRETRGRRRCVAVLRRVVFADNTVPHIHEPAAGETLRLSLHLQP